MTAPNVNAFGAAVDSSTNDLYVDDGFGETTVRHYHFTGPNQVLQPDSSTCTFTAAFIGSGCPPTESFGHGRLNGATGLAVDSSTQAVYAADTASGEVSLFGHAIIPDVVTGQESNVQATSATLNGTVNADGFPVTECKFEYGTTTAYGQSVPCVETVGSGSSPVAVHADITGLQPETFYHFRLLAANAQGQSLGADIELAPPAPPLIGTESADAIGSRRATLHAQINPHSVSTTFHFEYITEAQFQADGETFGAGTESTPESASIGEDFAYHSVSETLTGLSAETAYRFRVIATNSAGPPVDGTAQAFTTLAAALIEGPWATDVAGTSATLNANVDPLGASTEYRLEYGPSTAYGQSLTGTLGEGEAFVQVVRHLTGLQPATIYHYRLLTTTPVGTVEGADRTFMTQFAAAGSTLPDGRAWELVSPADKHGALIEPPEGKGAIQAAADGSGIAYVANQPMTESTESNQGEIAVLSSRAPGGWRTQEISLPKNGPEEESGEVLKDGDLPAPLFSSDLSQTVLRAGSTTPLLSEHASELTPYLRRQAQCESEATSGECFMPLVVGCPPPGEPCSPAVESYANVPPGTRFGFAAEVEHNCRIKVQTATPDSAHVVFATPAALTPEAVNEANNCAGIDAGLADHANLYEWTAGRLHLINVLLISNRRRATRIWVDGINDVAHTVSSDGRWVVWTHLGRFYLRDTIAEETVQIGHEGALFEAMSSDGSRIFYLEGGDLHVLETATGTQTDLTAKQPAGSAGVQDSGGLGVSDDGSYMYFMATGVLAQGGVAGANNLYLARYTAGEWNTTFVAMLSSEDEPSWSAENSGAALEQLLLRVTSRVSPGGRFVAFMSNRSLTGYDNVDALSGQRDEEVFVYDAVSGRLACASCSPTGARPHGLLDKALLVDRSGSWENHWVAGSVPGWDSTAIDSLSVYQPRFLSDSGRLFFNSPDALVPKDTNGLEDVYQYEPPGLGSCTASAATFSTRSGGCVDLISAGTSSGESSFYDASETGDDVFFVTASTPDRRRPRHRPRCL